MSILVLQVLPSLPEPSRPDPRVSALQKLFLDIAGEDREVDWMELKRILDHSMRDGECVSIDIDVGFSL